MEYVKICGLKEYEHIQLCLDKGADAVGFIYNVPKSPRNLDKKDLENLLTQIGNKILTVIVFKPANIIELEETMKDLKSSYFQIHINFDVSELEKLSNNLKEKIILALKVNQTNKQSVIEKINKYNDQFFAFLIDNSEGQGNELDIELVKSVLEKTAGARVIIAGGIKLENVEKVMNDLKPYGIDASSSLEFEKGVKDPLKIKDFLDKIKKITKNIRE